MKRWGNGKFCLAMALSCSLGQASIATNARGAQATDAKAPNAKPVDSRATTTAQKRFEAVTVRKVADSGPTNAPMTLPGGRFEMQNASVAMLITAVYGLRPINAPGWVASEKYTIRGKAADGATPQEINSMARTLLAERFSLVAHQENRATQVYFLRALRNDKRPGRWLEPRSTPCRPGDILDMPGFTPDEKPVPVKCSDSRVSPFSVQAAGVTMSYLGFVLTSLVPLGVPVVDETGISGTFDIRLRYSTKSTVAPDDAPWPTVFVALEDQLGLRLVPGQEQRPVLVIDRIERPSDDAQ